MHYCDINRKFGLSKIASLAKYTVKENSILLSLILLDIYGLLYKYNK